MHTSMFALSGSLLRNGEEYISGFALIDRVLKLTRLAPMCLAQKVAGNNSFPADFRPYHIVIGTEEITHNHSLKIESFVFDGLMWRLVEQRVPQPDIQCAEAPRVDCILYSNLTRALLLRNQYVSYDKWSRTGAFNLINDHML